MSSMGGLGVSQLEAGRAAPRARVLGQACAVLDEELDNGSVAIAGSRPNRNVVVARHVSSVLDEDADDFCMTMLSCQPQR